MRPSPAAQPGRSRLTLLPLVLLAAGVGVACREPGPTGNGGVRSVVIFARDSLLRPGFLMVASAQALGADGMVVEGRRITWRSLTPSKLAVSEDGVILALAPGQGIARASSGTVSAELHLDLVNPPIATLTIDVDSLNLSLPAGVRQLDPTALDSVGEEIFAPALTWESTAARIAAVTSAGQVNAVAVGRSQVVVRGDDRAATVEVSVDAPPSATSPVITSIAPLVALPGQQLVVNGTGFGASGPANTVLIDGTPIPVSAASPTQLVLALPPAPAFACEPTRVVALQVGTSGGIGVTPVTLQVAPVRSLAPGQSLVLTTANDARCLELVPAAGRYLLTVPNAARALGGGTGMALTLHGIATSMAGGGPAVADGALPRNASAARAFMARGETAARTQRSSPRDRARAATHARLMQANIDFVATARGTLPPPAPHLRAPATAALQVPTLGSVQPVRIPDISKPLPEFCTDYTAIGARVVFVGSHLVLLEDTLPVLDGQPTLAGQLDDTYDALGAELEAIGWPVLQTFGNPLVMDNRLDDNGRVALVFTPRMNQKLGGMVLAAVVNCDFFSRAQWASSNVGEYVYAQVPTSIAAGFAPGTRASWLHEMRATLVHELKHVASYAERIVHGEPLEEPWLEEATARHAEELYARAVFGTLRNANLGFAATLECELHAGDPAYPACVAAPRAMRPHFEALWSFLDAPMSRSTLGPTATGDFTFYGSAWALTRWLADQEGLAEAAFFTGLTSSGQSGIANLEGRSGRSWDEVLTEWSLAMALDDRSGAAPGSPRLQFPSWNLRSNFQGFCDLLGTCINVGNAPTYSRPYPLRPVLLDAGPFTLELPSIVPGGFVAVELNGGAGTLRQILALRGYRGGAMPGTVRLGVVRIE